MLTSKSCYKAFRSSLRPIIRWKIVDRTSALKRVLWILPMEFRNDDMPTWDILTKGQCTITWTHLKVKVLKKLSFSAPIVDSWPLMGSPLPLTLIFSIYLLFVLKVGPHFMRDRKPFNLVNFTRCYNVFQVTACIYFSNWAYKRGFSLSATWRCAENRTSQDEQLALYTINWNFIILRIIELVETCVFVLRKKQVQVSPLHVYHHISTAAMLWIFLKHRVNEMGIYPCALNSMVHIVMYSYYFLTSFKSLRNPLKIVKPVITIIQLIQLVLICGHTIIAVTSCNETKLYYIQIANILVLIGFFASFYVNNFMKNNKKEI